MNDAEAFARLIDTLRPWHDNVVIVGGWAHRLHRFHSLAAEARHPPLHTTEADVAFSARARLTGGLGEALTKAGFMREFVGDDNPPVTRYALDAERTAFYAEFLVPLSGSGQRRNGEPDVAMRAAGVTAQKLRDLDLLLMQPWLVQLRHDSGIPIATEVQVQVANPVSFMAQKLLIREQRPHRKRAQDALYIHDTLQLFGPSLDELRATWFDQLRVPVGPRRVADIERRCQAQYGAIDDVLRSAARLQPERELDPAHMQRACAYGLEHIFGTEVRGEKAWMKSEE